MQYQHQMMELLGLVRCHSPVLASGYGGVALRLNQYLLNVIKCVSTGELQLRKLFSTVPPHQLVLTEARLALKHVLILLELLCCRHFQ